MKRGIKNLVIIILALCMGYTALSQVVISFQPAIYGQTLEGLRLVQIFSNYRGSEKAYLKIKARNLAEGNVVSLITASFVLQKGMNQIDRLAFSRSSIVFGTNNSALRLSQTGRFPEGEYEYCYEVVVGDEKNGIAEYFENCFTSTIVPATPLLLIDPIDGDVLCNTKPNFTWQPPTPAIRDIKYRLILCEKKAEQTKEEAITFNIPIVTQSNIPVNLFPYPPVVKELTRNKKYVWQVTAYVNKTILTKSEIWDFEIKCDEEKEPQGGDSYRELKESQDGGYYVSNRVLRFSLYNAYSKGKLSYSITNSSHPEKKIKHLPELIVETGFNKFELDLSDNNSFKPGEEYVLKVQLQNGRQLSLRFIYRISE